MEQLKKLYYANDATYNRNSSFKRYWKFYDENNRLKNLEYNYNIYNISFLNSKTMIKEDIQKISESFFISFQDIKLTEKINNIDDWLKDNFKYIQNSYNNCMKSFEIIEYLKLQLGNYDFATTYAVGWSIKHFYTLYIDLYNTNITLNYKNKETKLSEQTLKTFIEKNKKLIIQAKENHKKKYIQHKNEIKNQEHIKKITETETEKLVIDKTKCDVTRRVGMHKKISSGFSIPRTLKERYETQACKPFQVKYPWEINN
jgi:hypothetical protein